MLKIVAAALLTFGFVIAIPVYAVDSTSSAATSSASSKNDKETEILNKISDKVNELGQSLKRAYSGKVRSLGTDTISLTTDSGEAFIETNEATKFYRIKAGARTTTEFKTLKIGEELTVIGTLDEATKTVTARQIIVKVRRQILIGKVTEVNKLLITVFSPTLNSKIVDISGTIPLKKVAPNGGLVSAKTPEVIVNSYLIAVGYYEPDDPNLSALRAIVIPRNLDESPATATPSAR